MVFSGRVSRAQREEGSLPGDGWRKKAAGSVGLLDILTPEIGVFPKNPTTNQPELSLKRSTSPFPSNLLFLLPSVGRC